MTVQEIIDIALAQGDNVPETDAGYVDRRRRALSFLREVQGEVWWSGNHTWKRKTSSPDLSVTALAGSVVVPADFDDLGPYGDLYLIQGGIVQLPALVEVPESQITESRARDQRTDTPGTFARFGQDPTTNRDLIQLPTNPTTLTLRLEYMKTPPDLKDAGDPDETPGAALTAANLALEQIPARFHQTVVLNGLKAKLRESKGDARWKKYDGDYQAGITRLKAQVARFQSQNRRLPNFFGERW